MAHEISFVTGLPSIAYKGDTPWHGYGQRINENLPLEEWQRQAQLDWEVERKQVFFQHGITVKQIPKKVALVRSDTKQPLSVVSDRYKVVQPKEVLQFFKDLIEEQGFEMNTAGCLKDGKRVWALADVGKSFRAKGVDPVGGYLLLATAYDGTFATTAQFTSIRVVCNNTLGFSLNRGGEGGIVRIPHTQDFKDYDVKAQLGLDTSWVRFMNNVTQLTEHKVTREQVIDYFLRVLDVTQDEVNLDGKQVHTMKKLMAAYTSGPGAQLPSAKDTLWGAVNAVTYITDHESRAANSGNRFDSASFGGGAKRKSKAFDIALSMAEAA